MENLSISWRHKNYCMPLSNGLQEIVFYDSFYRDKDNGVRSSLAVRGEIIAWAIENELKFSYTDRRELFFRYQKDMVTFKMRWG